MGRQSPAVHGGAHVNVLKAAGCLTLSPEPQHQTCVLASLHGAAAVGTPPSPPGTLRSLRQFPCAACAVLTPVRPSPRPPGALPSLWMPSLPFPASEDGPCTPALFVDHVLETTQCRRWLLERWLPSLVRNGSFSGATGVTLT